MPRIVPIQPAKSVADQVRDRLRDAIVDGEFGMGENISEERLTALFRVSRSPVRDALNELKFLGLVEIIPKRGSFVFLPDDAEVVDLCEYRLMLEREAAKLAMAHDAHGLTGRLREVCARMTRMQDSDDHAGYSRADAEYHAAFFDFCGNRLVRDAYALADARIGTLRTALTAPSDQRRDASFREHLTMVAQLEHGDMAAFAATLAEHIDRTRRVARVELRKFKERSDDNTARPA
ncbi:GntR family transcriptional regulator [Paracoccus sp. (in: a-proteobacteria)]|uniref:GntR family transcriptional regulator n=1 Tax=Paracoccus sp. TaxID=267 RepID=UPI003A8BC145